MKPIILAVAFTAAIFSACNQAAETTGASQTTAGEAKQPPAETTPEAAATPAITDPVCGMVKDSTWTDYTLYQGDTVWFCAAAEKTAFLGHPEKYAKNLPVHSSN